MKYIGSEERKALFGTPVLTKQIIRLCSNGIWLERESVYKVFSDRGRDTVRRMVNKLVGKGWLEESGGRLRSTEAGLHSIEVAADRLWKAARYLDEFTIADLQRMAGGKRTYVYEYLRIWMMHGYIREIFCAHGEFSVYKMVSTSVSRPVVGRRGDGHRYEK